MGLITLSLLCLDSRGGSMRVCLVCAAFASWASSLAFTNVLGACVLLPPFVTRLFGGADKYITEADDCV